MAGAGSAAVSGAGTPVAGPTGRDLFAEGLLEFLRPAVQQLDSHVHAVRESQVELREQIDNLATELCRINEDQKVALDLDPYVKKLLNARRRVVLVNNILQNAQGQGFTMLPRKLLHATPDPPTWAYQSAEITGLRNG
ncbi:SNARE-associated protein Snapin isoform X1 [Saimiri boliviensis]|uniref:SNARE-associated protein Snapin isoform X1 n=1 Tax=Saimiri boliviensis TaxID=27679 RepID=UPI003D7751D8